MQEEGINVRQLLTLVSNASTPKMLRLLSPERAMLNASFRTILWNVHVALYCASRLPESGSALSCRRAVFTQCQVRRPRRARSCCSANWTAKRWKSTWVSRDSLPAIGGAGVGERPVPQGRIAERRLAWWYSRHSRYAGDYAAAQ